MRRLPAHPAVADALAAAKISESWGRQICEWTDLLPREHRGAGDQILLAAAAGRAGRRDLEELFAQIPELTARPADDGDDWFDDRSLQLARTSRGAAQLNGDLTPPCAAPLAPVLAAPCTRLAPA